jgi:DNA-binding MarR family transcriptional regulator
MQGELIERLTRAPSLAVSARAAAHSAKRGQMSEHVNERPLQLTAQDDWRVSNTGRLLFNTAQRFEEGILRIVNANGFARMRMAHMAMPRNMDLDGTRITTLASRASMTKQSMADLVAQCEHMGLVTRRPDTTDGRAKMIVFTPKGRRLIEVIRRAIATMEREMRSQMGAVLHKQVRLGLKLYLEAAVDEERSADDGP